ncbi:hypothetical protein PTTG_07994 [Puccinia triticina 1-1 BBBD Race 1]|uniref:No apical meristem-associated C-terminal domain-containing protein n=2 Tax=Puccinia triticina TaxID=208348 RepID=A0A0C4F4F4_PUCT1|nr:uncharacterized protein PtA15_2A213 [Puccinia triticina]OAV91978.1 hypothetical protein PTTG_07994 [Puccinia triticina 1-1 BBBD Race 1]WAQ81900.1 hypothetical protein PtA15_2A213 [Puccinia triticina]WAR52784.1 hypothetical protein PtB15_2B210 [Puccinia triticina]
MAKSNLNPTEPEASGSHTPSLASPMATAKKDYHHKPTIKAIRQRDLTPDVDDLLVIYWLGLPESNLAGPGTSEPKQLAIPTNLKPIQTWFQKENGYSIRIKLLRRRLIALKDTSIKFSNIFSLIQQHSLSLGQNTSYSKMMQCTREAYKAQNGKPFAFKSAWCILWDHPTWRMTYMDFPQPANKPPIQKRDLAGQTKAHVQPEIDVALLQA